NDRVVEQGLGARLALDGVELRRPSDQLEGLRLQGKTGLQQVHEALVGVVERDRRTARAGADLRPRLAGLGPVGCAPLQRALRRSVQRRAASAISHAAAALA